jgi:hypothetical protein
MNALRGLRVFCLSLAFAAPAAAVWAAEPGPQPLVAGAASSAKASTHKVAAAAKVDSKADAQVEAKAAPKAKAAATAKPKPTKAAARKNKARKEADAVAAPVPPAKLDLSLPKAMVDNLEPASKEAAKPVAGKPLLPALFPDKKPATEDFQMSGRLLSNEMQLPMIRNEGRHDIEGAAVEFQFKQ